MHPSWLGAMSVLVVAAAAAAQNPDIPTRRFIVTVKAPAAGGPSLESFDSLTGVRVWYKYREPLYGFAATLTDSAQARLHRMPGIVGIEQDEFVHNPAPVREAGLKRVNKAWALEEIGAASLSETGGKNVTVYVLDSGLRGSHREFGGRATLAVDFMGDKNENGDCEGHGTHVAGLIGGRTQGVARGTTIVGVRVLDCGGFGTASSVVAGLQWVMQHLSRPAVINLSLVTHRDISSASLDSAVRAIAASGIPIVAAAGNNSDDACKFSPADGDAVITVGAIDTKHRRAGFSNYGRCLKIFAPGVDIVSASKDDDTRFAILDGTSQAAGFVSGVVALLLQRVPAISPDSVRAALFEVARRGLLNLRESPDRALVVPPLHAPVHASVTRP